MRWRACLETARRRVAEGYREVVGGWVGWAALSLELEGAHYALLRTSRSMVGPDSRRAVSSSYSIWSPSQKSAEFSK